MKVVIDTNCLLVSVSPFSKYHWLFESIVYEDIMLFVTTEIISEYSEVFGEKLSIDVANKAIRTLGELSNVVPTHIYYHFDLIQNDPDDNKFVDCAIAVNADYIVTNDKHFNVLKDIPFPKVTIIKLEEFEKILHDMQNFEIINPQHKITVKNDVISIQTADGDKYDFMKNNIIQGGHSIIYHLLETNWATKEMLYDLAQAIYRRWPSIKINWLTTFERVEFVFYSNEVAKLEIDESKSPVESSHRIADLNIELRSEPESEEGKFEINARANLLQRNIILK